MRRIYLLYRSCPVLEFLSPPKFASCRPAVAHSTWRCFVEDADHSRHCLFRPAGTLESSGNSARPQTWAQFVAERGINQKCPRGTH